MLRMKVWRKKTKKIGAQDSSGEEGQALFELIIFLPLLLVLFAYFVSIGNSINASINQQKAVRGYFYYLLKGNSRAPIVKDLDYIKGKNFGMAVLGWRESVRGETPVSPCFKLVSFFGEVNPGETCEEPDVGGGISQFIRVFTAYGVCSENYEKRSGNGFQEIRRSITTGSCANQ